MKDIDVHGSKRLHEQRMHLRQQVPHEIQKGSEISFDDSQGRVRLKLRINCCYESLATLTHAPPCKWESWTPIAAFLALTEGRKN